MAQICPPERFAADILAPFYAAVADILECLDPVSVGRWSCCSVAAYAFGTMEDLWMPFVLERFNGRFKFRNSWRQTFRESLASGPQGPDFVPIPCDGLYSDVLFQRLLCAQSNIKDEPLSFVTDRWLKRETIKRVDVNQITLEQFNEEYVIGSRPVILTGIADKWPAFMLWTREYLIKQSGDTLFEAGGARFSLENFFVYADKNKDEAPAFVFDPNFADRVPQLGKDYFAPSFFSDDLFALLPERPNYRWILLGNRKSGSKWHIDPNRTHAWNAVIRGTTPVGVYPSHDGGDVTQPLSVLDWYLNFYTPTLQQGGLLEGTCHAGEMMFIPSNWWHSVVNLENDTFAVTQNCVTREIVPNVRWFLKERADHVSGVAESRKKSLYKEFDDVLLLHRPDLLDVPLRSGERSLVGGRQNMSKKIKYNSSDKSTTETSIWDKLRQSNTKIKIGPPKTPTAVSMSKLHLYQDPCLPSLIP